MPYIKQEYRKPLEPLIQAVLEGRKVCVLDAPCLEDLFTGMGLDYTQIDGCINYILTSVLKNAKCAFDYDWFVHNTLVEFYLSNPNYYKFNRLAGLLSNMIDEFKRRKWSVSSRVYLKNWDKRFRVLLHPYEDRKMRENGDI
jgi:hypothetical protein